ncbi:MAG: hypothetical protein C0631_18660 [Sedimenticola sp.]|jgi:urease alpha subunit|nr:MAG: hypothetical protein C0631_18660 [Sedimenticola sp.]
MELNIIIDDYSMNLNIPDDFISASQDSFERLDASMAEGVQLGQDWIEQPDVIQRCRAAADKLLAALESHNEALAMLSAGYIVTRMPGTKQVKIDNSGEPNATVFA